MIPNEEINYLKFRAKKQKEQQTSDATRTVKFILITFSRRETSIPRWDWRN